MTGRGAASISGSIYADSESGGANNRYPKARTPHCPSRFRVAGIFSGQACNQPRSGGATGAATGWSSAKSTAKRPVSPSRWSGVRSWRDSPSSTRP